MNPRVSFIAAICCVIPLTACKKPAAQQGNTASPESQEVDPKTTEAYKERMAEGYKLLGVLNAKKMTRGWAKYDIEVAQERYDRAKSKLSSATSSASLERAKLEAEDARDALIKTQQTYDKSVEEAKALLAKAKEVLREDYHEDDDEMLKEIPFNGPPKQ